MDFLASAAIPANPARRPRAGFTLLEVVVAIAIIGLVSSLVVVNFDTAFGSMKSRPPADIFRNAVRQARYEAAYRMQKAYLAFDPEKNSFSVVAADGTDCGEYPLNRDPSQGKFEVTFTPYRPDEEMGGQDESRLSDYAITRLIFDPSGCSVPVKVSIKGPGENIEMDLDPFSWGPPPKRDLEHF